MIPCTQPLNAIYLSSADDSDAPVVVERPVLAFQVDGGPLVAGDDRLVPASTYEGFTRLSHPSTNGLNIIGTAPADGWRVQYTNEAGAVWSKPLVAWAVTNDGTVIPCRTLDEPERVRVFHPDQVLEPTT